MKKAICLLFSLILLISALALCTSAAGDYDKPFYGRADKSFYAKQEPSSSAASGCYVSSGTDIVIFGEYGEWYAIMYIDSSKNAFFGFADKKKVHILYNARTTDDRLKVRSSTSTSSDNNVKGILPKYTSLICIGEKLSNGWCRVEGPDEETGKTITGYSSGDYLTIDGQMEYNGGYTFPDELKPEDYDSISRSDASDETEASEYVDYDSSDYDYDYSSSFGRPIEKTDYTRVWAWFSVVGIGIYAIVTIFRITAA